MATPLLDTPGSIVFDAAPPSLARHLLREAWRLPLLVWLSATVIFFTAWASIAPGTLVSHSPLETDLLNTLGSFSADHWLGTDEIGRDLYARLVFGARESFLIGILAMIIAIALAVPLGFLASLPPPFARGAVDRLIEILLSFPTLLVALLFVTILGQSPFNVAVAVGIGAAPGYARLLRGQALLVRSSAYVEAAIALGHTRARILLQHIIPNAMRPLIPVTGLGVGKAIVWSSSLSYLGLGVKPPSSEWGALLAAGKVQLLEAPSLIVIPGTAVVLVALSFSTLFSYIQARSEGAKT